jgi:D-alanyl-D-alanine carboxypeptidase
MKIRGPRFRRGSSPEIQGSLSAIRHSSRGQPTIARAAIEVVAVESDTLLRIVQHLNAFSVNSMAEFLALHVGGPRGVEQFLIQEIGMTQALSSSPTPPDLTSTD